MRYWLLVFSVFLLFTAAAPAPDYAKELNKQFMMIHLQEAARLYNQGRISEAVEVAESTLKFAGDVLGPNHPDLATPLNNLALLYQAQGEYAKAEPLYQKAIALQEQTTGFETLELAKTFNNLALLDQLGALAAAALSKSSAN